VIVNYAGAVAITLASGGGNVVVVDGSGAASANPITVTPSAGSISGQSSYVINSNYGAAMFVAAATFLGLEWLAYGSTPPNPANNGFTTGDVKFTLKSAADAGWIILGAGQTGDGTIGSAGSSATLRANADTQALFTLIWSYGNATNFPIFTSGGVPTTYGGSAAADFSANKRLQVGFYLSRVLGVAGQGALLSNRAVGDIIGNESTNAVPAHTHGLNGGTGLGHSHTATDSGHTHSLSGQAIPTGSTFQGGSGYSSGSGTTGSGTANVTIGTALSGITATDSAGVSSISLFEPTTFLNLMIKL
jgi:hypothetical protein